MSSLIVITVANGRGHNDSPQYARFPTHIGIENWKMYAIKQTKICAKYRDMVPKASTGLSVAFQYILYRIPW